MTLPALRQAMHAVYERAGDDLAAPQLSAKLGRLRQMHELRNRALFGIGDETHRRRMCGRPAQA